MLSEREVMTETAKCRAMPTINTVTKYVLMVKTVGEMWTPYAIPFNTAQEAVLQVCGDKMQGNSWLAYRIIEVSDLPIRVPEAS